MMRLTTLTSMLPPLSTTATRCPSTGKPLIQERGHGRRARTFHDGLLALQEDQDGRGDFLLADEQRRRRRSGCTMPRVRSETRLTAMPSAIVLAAGMTTGACASSPALMEGSARVCTPYTFTEGALSLTAMAIPDARPPPPMGTTTASMSGCCSKQLQADGPLPGDHVRIVERVHVDVARGIALGRGVLGGLVVVRAVEHDLRAVGLRGLDLHERRRFGHHHRDADAEPRRVIRNGEPVVARARRHHARAPLVVGHEQEPVAGAALLEGTRHLQVLELQEDASSPSSARASRFARMETETSHHEGAHAPRGCRRG